MIKIASQVFGEIEVDKNQIITFPEGIYGFEEVQEYVLIGETNEDMPFQWLQAVNGSVCFVVINPICIEANYDINVPDQQLKIIQADATTQFMLVCIVVVPENMENMTANLKSPLVINLDNRLGMQTVLENVPYQIKHPVVQQAKG